MDKTYSMLGIGRKAGYIKIGETPCIEAIKKNKCHLLIIASDASDNTKKRFNNLSKRYYIKNVVFGEKTKLGKAIGKELISSIAVINEEFSKAIQDIFD